MKLANKWTSDLLGKDKKKSESAAKHIINTPDIEAWKCLIENSEYIFSFIKEKAILNLVKEINKDNFNNLFELFKIYSAEFDDYLTEMLSCFSCDELDQRIFRLLKTGSCDEKAYAAKYFYYVNYTQATSQLFELLNSESEEISINAAKALGQMNEEKAYEYLVEKLKNGDSWEKVKSAQLLTAFNRKEALFLMIETMYSCDMAEYIAGEIALLSDICELLESADNKIRNAAPDVLDKIITGIPLVWDIDVVVDFKLYDCADKLIKLSFENNNQNLLDKYATLLLRMKYQMYLFANDPQYTFDQEKHVINEINNIVNLLESLESDFWENKVDLLNNKLFSENESDVLESLSLIKEFKFESSVPYILDMIYENDNNQLLFTEAILALADMDKISLLDNVESILSNIKDENLRIIINYCINNKE